VKLSYLCFQLRNSNNVLYFQWDTNLLCCLVLLRLWKLNVRRQMHRHEKRLLIKLVTMYLIINAEIFKIQLKSIRIFRSVAESYEELCKLACWMLWTQEARVWEYWLGFSLVSPLCNCYMKYSFHNLRTRNWVSTLCRPRHCYKNSYQGL
jgi:hypothetical protein